MLKDNKPDNISKKDQEAIKNSKSKDFELVIG